MRKHVRGWQAIIVITLLRQHSLC